MKRFLFIAWMAAATVLCFTGCTEKVKVSVDESMLVGKWHATDIPTEHWRFDRPVVTESGEVRGGETWDLGDDVQEGEGTKFNWSTQYDELRIDLYGEMGQHVYYDWTVTHQTKDSLTFKDFYGNYRTFVKI